MGGRTHQLAVDTMSHLCSYVLPHGDESYAEHSDSLMAAGLQQRARLRLGWGKNTQSDTLSRFGCLTFCLLLGPCSCLGLLLPGLCPRGSPLPLPLPLPTLRLLQLVVLGTDVKQLLNLQNTARAWEEGEGGNKGRRGRVTDRI